MHALTETTAEKQCAEADYSSQDYRALLSIPERLRARFFDSANPQQQKELGQFLTPPHVADLMATMFRLHRQSIRLLDPGAGMGILSAAFIRRQLLSKDPPRRIEITAYELDSALIPGIEETCEACRIACHGRGIEFSAIIRNVDFIAESAEMLRNDFFSRTLQTYDAAIVNPPYGKLSTTSDGYRLLRAVNAETTNLYTAFLNLIIGLLRPEGELVAITPRSFCNGPYFKPFRRRLLAEMSFRRIHVFDSRTAAFKHDNVLQENVILHAIKQAQQPRTIRVSQSAGGERDAVHTRVFPANEIVSPDDSEAFIHIPTSSEHIAARDQVSHLGSNLPALGLTVSTGRVVDFRARDFIRQQSEPGTTPLVYPCHFNGLFVAWPKERSRKPNAILDNDQTRSLLVPAGVYVLTKRFTSKEERRRIVACIYDPDRVKGQLVGFENHLNYIHANGKGLDMALAKGLWAFLNSSALDLYFRQFNGHTQVNATDLRNVRFPTVEQLRGIGSHIGEDSLGQHDIDEIVTGELKA
ncbi:MAG: N-6 DNA methylase [Lentisphaerae bacterium]|nr:N-6 DNA methylase [Lentisphaerota bacterium]